MKSWSAKSVHKWIHKSEFLEVFFLATIVPWLKEWQCGSVGQPTTLVRTEISPLNCLKSGYKASE